MSDSHPSVLITGANGFIGSRLCRHFLDEGFTVFAGVRHTANLTLLNGLDVTFRFGDIVEPSTLSEMVTGVDYIVHNAGVVKARNREMFFRVNETGTGNVMQAILERNPDVRKVVQISSLAVAGPSRPGRPVKETDQPNPITTYGESKAAGERTALAYADRLPIVSVRPPAVYGPGDKELFTLFQIVYRRLKPLIGNPDRRLQLVHVDDLCRGIFMATTANTASGAIYFIAEKQSHTMLELMNILQQASGRKAFTLLLPAPLFRAIATVSEAIFRAVGATPMLTRMKTRELLASWEISTARAKKELGFESSISLLEGARQTFTWYREKGWL